jgi:alkanesulfonate monooxygenase SsuD/methylene tetrahydromethanopterin reductase-like flavin-dependent oxidoreductase (luciferase family)
MRFSYHPSMCDPSFYLELGKAAEAAGFDAITFQTAFAIQKNVIRHIHIMMMVVESFLMECLFRTIFYHSSDCSCYREARIFNICL